MASSLFPLNNQQSPQNNGMLGRLGAIHNAIANNNPTQLFNSMMNNNPQFAQFVHENEGKSPQQIAAEHGIDPNLVSRFIK